MFEFLGTVSAIPKNQLYLYYFVLALLYLLFLRGLRPTILTAIIFLLFNQGFFDGAIIGFGPPLIKGVISFLLFLLLFRTNIGNLDKRDRAVLIIFVLFTVVFFFGYLYNGINLLWGLFQYYKFFLPVSLFFIVKGMNMGESEYYYYYGLIIKLMWFQIAFSVVKLLIIGFRENIVGSINNAGGSTGIGLSIFAIIMLWVMRGKRFLGKDWWFILLLLIIPVASNKRAIWLIYPLILFILHSRIITVQTMKRALVIVFVLVYVGFRLNPSFNPEKQLWGSFDPKFAYEYILSYSGVSTDRIEGDLAEGRWGTNIALAQEIIRRPFSEELLIGIGKTRGGGSDRYREDFVPEDYGFASQTVFSGIGIVIIQFGWIIALLVFLLFLNVIYSIPDRKVANIFAFFFLWEYIIYNGGTVFRPVSFVVLVLSVRIVSYFLKHPKESNETLSFRSPSELYGRPKLDA